MPGSPLRLSGDLWYVRTQGKADPKFRSDSVFPVVLQQPFPYIAGGHTNNRVLTRVVRGNPSKQRYPDNPLFQARKTPGNRLFHNVSEELSAAMAPLERFSLNHFLEVLLKPGNISFCLYDSCYPSAGLGS